MAIKDAVVPVFRPKFPDLDRVLPLLESMYRADRYSNRGPLVQRLEEVVAQRVKVRPSQVVATSSATAALTGLVSVFPPTMWIVPAWSFAATAQAVLQAGKRIAFSDVDLDSWALKTWNVEDADVGQLPVCPYGARPDASELNTNGFVVLDAAASLGCGQLSLADLPPNSAVVFSLHATKVFPAGEGGIAVLGTEKHAEALREWINFGFKSDTRLPIRGGTNAKMAEGTAAFGLAAQHDAQVEIDDWHRVINSARQIAEDVSLESRLAAPGDVNPYWIGCFPDATARDRVADILRCDGIETRIWWGPPLSSISVFSTGLTANHFPNAELLASSCLGLPLHRHLNDGDFSRIHRSLGKALRLTR